MAPTKQLLSADCGVRPYSVAEYGAASVYHNTLVYQTGNVKPVNIAPNGSGFSSSSRTLAEGFPKP